MPHKGPCHATDMRGDLLPTTESPLHGISRGFRGRFEKAQAAAGSGDTAQRALACRRVIRKTFCDALDCREARCWTRTAKLWNSNSLMATNNRFGLVLDLVKNFIMFSN